MKAQDAIGQLLKEKNDLQIFAHKAVEQYNQSADRHHKLSLAYDALLKAASEHQSKDCESCKVLAEKMKEANSLNPEQRAVGKQMIQKLKVDLEGYKKSLHVQEEVTRLTEQRFREANGYNMR